MKTPRMEPQILQDKEITPSFWLGVFSFGM